MTERVVVDNLLCFVSNKRHKYPEDLLRVIVKHHFEPHVVHISLEILRDQIAQAFNATNYASKATLSRLIDEGLPTSDMIDTLFRMFHVCEMNSVDLPVFAATDLNVLPDLPDQNGCQNVLSLVLEELRRLREDIFKPICGGNSALLLDRQRSDFRCNEKSLVASSLSDSLLQISSKNSSEDSSGDSSTLSASSVCSGALKPHSSVERFPSHSPTTSSNTLERAVAKIKAIKSEPMESKVESPYSKSEVSPSHDAAVGSFKNRLLVSSSPNTSLSLSTALSCAMDLSVGGGPSTTQGQRPQVSATKSIQSFPTKSGRSQGGNSLGGRHRTPASKQLSAPAIELHDYRELMEAYDIGNIGPITCDAGGGNSATNEDCHTYDTKTTIQNRNSCTDLSSPCRSKISPSGDSCISNTATGSSSSQANSPDECASLLRSAGTPSNHLLASPPFSLSLAGLGASSPAVASSFATALQQQQPSPPNSNSIGISPLLLNSLISLRQPSPFLLMPGGPNVSPLLASAAAAAAMAQRSAAAAAANALFSSAGGVSVNSSLTTASVSDESSPADAGSGSGGGAIRHHKSHHRPSRKRKSLPLQRTVINGSDGGSGEGSDNKNNIQHKLLLATTIKTEEGLLENNSDGGTNIANDGTSGEDDSIKPYGCNYANCTKRFANKFLLKKHEFIHTGERPHQCPYCGKRFNRKDNLLRHKKTHLSNNCSPASRKRSVFGVLSRDSSDGGGNNSGELLQCSSSPLVDDGDGDFFGDQNFDGDTTSLDNIDITVDIDENEDLISPQQHDHAVAGESQSVAQMQTC